MNNTTDYRYRVVAVSTVTDKREMDLSDLPKFECPKEAQEKADALSKWYFTWSFHVQVVGTSDEEIKEYFDHLDF